MFLADDDCFDRQQVVSSFKKANKLNINAYKDGKELIDAISLTEPDFILLDMSMPILDGFGVLEYIKNNSLLNIFVIVMSSSYIHAQILEERKAHKPRLA